MVGYEVGFALHLLVGAGDVARQRAKGLGHAGSDMCHEQVVDCCFERRRVGWQRDDSFVWRCHMG